MDCATSCLVSRNPNIATVDYVIATSWRKYISASLMDGSVDTLDLSLRSSVLSCFNCLTNLIMTECYGIHNDKPHVSLRQRPPPNQQRRGVGRPCLGTVFVVTRCFRRCHISGVLDLFQEIVISDWPSAAITTEPYIYTLDTG